MPLTSAKLKFYGQKILCIRLSDTKNPFFMPTILLSPSSRFQKHTNPTILMDAKQLTLTF